MSMIRLEEKTKDGCILSSKRIFIKGSEAEEIDYGVSSEIEEVEQAEESVREIEDKIFELAIKRVTFIKNLERSANSVTGALLGKEKEISAIVSSWEKFGMSSPLVKETVKAVRRVLFEDDKPEFQHVIFIGIKSEYQQRYFETSTSYFKLIFCKDNFDPTSLFTISIPIAGAIFWNWKYCYINGNYRVTYAWSNAAEQVEIARSFSLVKIARAVKAIVMNDKDDIASLSKELEKQNDKMTFEESRNEIVHLMVDGLRLESD